MSNKDKVLNALINAAKSNDTVDFMELVNHKVLRMTESEFNDVMYNLYKDNIINGLVFDTEDSHKIILWDDITIDTPNFKLY